LSTGNNTLASTTGDFDVSVVVPLHNRKALIPYTLESLRGRHHPDVSLEVIVVDDGSTDGGAELVQATFEWVSLHRQTRQGAPVARNHGISLASAPALLLLDSDDLVEPGFFQPRLAALAAHVEAAGAYGPWDVFEGDQAFAPEQVRPRHERYPIDEFVDADSHLARLLRGWYIAPSAILWRTAAVRSVGGHDERLRINQDVDFMFRILMSTAGIVGSDGPRALSRNHAGPRQGQVTSPDRVEQIVELRRRFRRVLEVSGRLDDRFRRALAEYAFDGWATWRTVAPESASALLSLSRELWPVLSVRGGWLLRTLGAVVGPAKATILKQKLETWRRSSSTA
jgi:glycosyltransferase involved in cell wall biosynthesis